MQNLPITITAQPVTPAQTPNPSGNNTAPTAESFGNVLARQRANADEPKPKTGMVTRDKGQPTSTSPNSLSTDSAPVAADNELEAPVPDVAGILSGDMLAALLPAATNLNSVAASEKPASQAPMPDGASTLPSDMLAILLSAPANANSVAADEKPASRASMPDGASTLENDILAESLAAPSNANSAAANEKPVARASTPDGVSALPGDMFAALLPSPATAPQGASAASQQQSMADGVQGAIQQQPIAGGVQGGMQQQPIAAGTPGGARQQPIADGIQGGIQGGIQQQLITVGEAGGTRQQLVAADARSGAQQPASASQFIGEQTATSLFRTQSNTAPTVDTTQGKTFSAVMEALGKDAANAALSAAATQTPAQAALPDSITLPSPTQNAALPIAASQNGPVQMAVNTPITHDAWGEEFNQQVTWLATTQHEQSAELHLNPPHLGPLDVVLNISGDQATALFTSPHANVREAVEQALPKLREMLADNGIMLGNATVNDQPPKEQQAGQANKPRGDNASSLGKAVDTVPVSGAVWPVRRHQGMVDTFA